KTVDFKKFKGKLSEVNTMVERIGWKSLCEIQEPVYKDLIKAFYMTLKDQNNGSLKASVKGVEIEITEDSLAEILGCTKQGHKLTERIDRETQRLGIIGPLGNIVKKSLDVNQLAARKRIIHSIITTIITPRAGTHSIISSRDGNLLFWAIQGHPVNLPAVIMERMRNSSNLKESLPYGPLLTVLFKKKNIELEDEMATPHKEKIGISTLKRAHYKLVNPSEQIWNKEKVPNCIHEIFPDRIDTEYGQREAEEVEAEPQAVDVQPEVQEPPAEVQPTVPSPSADERREGKEALHLSPATTLINVLADISGSAEGEREEMPSSDQMPEQEHVREEARVLPKKTQDQGESTSTVDVLNEIKECLGKLQMQITQVDVKVDMLAQEVSEIKNKMDQRQAEPTEEPPVSKTSAAKLSEQTSAPAQQKSSPVIASQEATAIAEDIHQTAEEKGTPKLSSLEKPLGEIFKRKRRLVKKASKVRHRPMQLSIQKGANSAAAHQREPSDIKQEGFLQDNTDNMHASYVYKRRKLRNSVVLLSEDNDVGSMKGRSACNSSPKSGCISLEKFNHHVQGIPTLSISTSSSIRSPTHKPIDVLTSQPDDTRYLLFSSDHAMEEQRQPVDKAHQLASEYKSLKDSCSSSKSNMGQVSSLKNTEMDDDEECSLSSKAIVEPSVKHGSARDTCISALVSCDQPGDHPNNSVCSSVDEFFGNDTLCLSCKLCGLRKLPVDDWYCQPCLWKKPKLLPETLSGKLFSIMSKKQRKKVLQDKLGPILCMLEDTNPYTSGVRIGKDFQVEVPEWTGPLIDDDDYFDEPLELGPAECYSLNGWSIKRSSRPSSIGNWLQCRAMIKNEDEGVVCGKWRR
ncbi:hypothetical protein Taro_033754, partial [Colocasia esculenta]|nr:hypothetical protein [Colocasia esculenta]